jgi:Tol biopolymer transport system component
VFGSLVDGLTAAGNPSIFVRQVYLANLQTGAITLVSKSPSGEPGNGSTNLYGGNATYEDTFRFPFDLSDDGRYVAFHSSASNLVDGDTNGQQDLFLYDRVADSVVRIDHAPGGAQSSGVSYNPSISADGRYVAFVSTKSDLVVGDSNGCEDAFRYDRDTGTIIRVSIGNDGAQANDPVYNCSIDGAGDTVAFDTFSDNLIAAADTNGYNDCFVREIDAGTTERISVTSGGSQTVPFDFVYKSEGSSFGPSISADGRHVAFTSYAANLDPSVQFPAVSTVFLPNNKLYIHNRDSGETTALIPVQVADAYGETPVLSADGRVVALWSQSAALIANDNNARYDAFLAPNPAHPAATASGFALWQLLNYYHLAGDAATGGPEADSDQDSIPNLWEYMLGLDSKTADIWPQEHLTFSFSSSNHESELSFLIDPTVSDVDWSVLSTPSLGVGNWATVPLAAIRTESTVEAGRERIHLFISPPPEESQMFYRLQLLPQNEI